MRFSVNTQTLRDSSTRTRAAKDRRYIRQLGEMERSVNSSRNRMVPLGGVGASAALSEEVAKVMRTAHSFGRQVDAHCDFLNSSATSYESAENALIKQANSLPIAFGWRS